MRLKDKVAVVTGTGDGIGRGIATRFASEGAAVALCDIDAVMLEETAELARQAGATVFAMRVDLREERAIETFVAEAAKRFGRIDILVNNAAIMPVSPVEELEADLVDQILAVNLRAPILLSKYVTPYMREAGGGSIIHMASVTGHNGTTGTVVYGATKGALMALARGQAVELAPLGIRVNTVSPGAVDSPMLHRFIQEHASDAEGARKSFNAMHPRGKIGTIDEVAAVLVFLASDEAANITAEDVRCDGGLAVQSARPQK